MVGDSLCFFFFGRFISSRTRGLAHVLLFFFGCCREWIGWIGFNLGFNSGRRHYLFPPLGILVDEKNRQNSRSRQGPSRYHPKATGGSGWMPPRNRDMILS